MSTASKLQMALMLIWWALAQCIYCFFQAEDGIRDLTVTGVQTCALPIYTFAAPAAQGMSMTGKSTSWNKLLRSPYPCDHIIQLFTSPEVLVRALARFVGSALEQGEAAVVIAAAKRIAALTKRLVETGYDVASTNGQGAFVTLDAERCLAKGMADGGPDRAVVRSVVTPLPHPLAAARRK